VRNSMEALAGSERRELIITTAPASGGLVEVRVSDSGPGLAEEVAKQLFQPFVTTKAKGMGLGLSISRSIIDAHGGRMQASPNPGGGMTFSFALPSGETAG
jgi:two-component system sensor kinase FixL